MKYIITVLRNHKKTIIHLAKNWRWVAVLFIGLCFFSLQFYELNGLKFLNRSVHLFEVVFYGILIIINAMIIELFARSNRSNEKLLSILNFKHEPSLDFVVNHNLERVYKKLAELPGKVADVGETSILVHPAPNEHFEVASVSMVASAVSMSDTNWFRIDVPLSGLMINAKLTSFADYISVQPTSTENIESNMNKLSAIVSGGDSS